LNLENWMASSYQAMGMKAANESPFGCGTYCEGDGSVTDGYFWYLVHDDYFVITKCDFTFAADTLLHMPQDSLYISLRLDYAGHLLPGKILAFMEERGLPTQTVMEEDRRVAYTEVLYTPAFYRRHLDTAFISIGINPVEILKNMGGEHNWSSEMMDVLTDIHECEREGREAELYYVAKAYELMADLVAMGTSRLPKKGVDYEHILRVISFIDQNYTRALRQADLVRLSSMSSTKLKNLFHQFTGSTITDYIAEKKADRAAHLLADSDLPVEGIAKEVGFDTATGFTTAFKKRMGISPSDYRRQMQASCMTNPSEMENLKF